VVRQSRVNVLLLFESQLAAAIDANPTNLHLLVKGGGSRTEFPSWSGAVLTGR